MADGDGEVYTPPALADVNEDIGSNGSSSGNSSANEEGCFTNNGGTHGLNGHAP